MTEKRKKFITFVGGIGSGKTTATELIARNFSFTPIKEEFGENNFLPLFYEEMKKWAFHSQLFFLIKKLNQLLKIKNTLKKKSVVLDTSILQDLCFLETQKILGNITRKEHEIYYFIYNKIKRELPRPDLLIYLKTSPEHLKKLIFQRGRRYEIKIPISYLKALVRAQDKVIRKNKKSAKILTIDTSKMFFEKNRKDRGELLDMIKNSLKKAL